MRMPRPRHGTVIAYAALFFALGGTAIAATGGSFVLGHANKASQPTSLKNTGYGPALQLANGHAGDAPFTINGNKHLVPGLNANYLGGHPASYYARGGTLPSGQSESGMFSAAEGTSTGSGGWIGAGVSYPRPLAHAIQNSHIIDVQGVGPVDHCAGPGQAERGYLCLYNWIRSGVSAGYGYSDEGSSFSTPSVGAVLYFPVTGSYAYAGGEWTVTAP
jgi:hypothetical protein